MKIKTVELSVFEDVFSSGGSGCRETCACGKEFFDAVNSWDWNDGEFEALQADPEAIGLDGAVARIEIEGVYFVTDCDCWHERAKKIINWLEYHGEIIGEYFRELKKARIAAAEEIPVDISFPFPEGFRSMVGAPKNATWITVLMENGTTQNAHWAQDLSGEDQPMFRGWFIKSGDHDYSPIDEPIAWKPIEKEK